METSSFLYYHSMNGHDVKHGDLEVNETKLSLGGAKTNGRDLCSVAFSRVAGASFYSLRSRSSPAFVPRNGRAERGTMTPRTGDSEISTPKTTLKKSNPGSQSLKGQKSILGFFGKKSSTPSTEAPTAKFEAKAASQLTPAPSSDGPPYSSPIAVETSSGKNKENGLPSPASPLSSVNDADRAAEGLAGNSLSSPSRKVNHDNTLEFSSQQLLTCL